MFTFSKKIQESVHHLHGPPKKRTVRLEKKTHVKSWPGVFSVRRLSMGQREVDPSLTSFTSAPRRAAVPRTKSSRKPWKSGVLLDFFRNNYAKCFLLVNFFGFGSWPLFFWSSFFGGFPTKWCLWLHDSIHDHRRSRFWNSCPRPNDVWWSLKKLRQFRLHSAVFSVWGRRICMYLL